jgi:hypothetical protein
MSKIQAIAPTANTALAPAAQYVVAQPGKTTQQDNIQAPNDTPRHGRRNSAFDIGKF